MAEKKTEKRKIRLADAQPVIIDPGQWPVIASAEWHDGEVRSQANRSARIMVREHRYEDGPEARCIVYGWTDTKYQGERGAASGYRTAAGIGYADVITALRRVGEDLGRPDLARECIQDLPVEEL